MTNVCALILILVSSAVHADPYFLQTRRGRQRFDEVERISRNHDFNEYRGGELTLRPYIQLDDHDYLGLDEDGRLMQVLVTPERTLGFLLSGEHRLVDVFYRPGGALLAIDDRGEVLTFDRDRWAQKPGPALKRKILSSLGLTLFAAAATGAYVGLQWDLSPIDVLVPGLPVVLGLVLQHGLFYAMAWSEENNSTDGLRPTGYSLDQFRSSEGIDAHGGGAEDYLLHARGGARSLRGVLNELALEPSEIFAASCEATLARGYPIRMPYAESAPRVKPKLLGRRD